MKVPFYQILTNHKPRKNRADCAASLLLTINQSDFKIHIQYNMISISHVQLRNTIRQYFVFNA